MNMHIKRWLIVAIILIIVGLAAFAAAMSANHWDFFQAQQCSARNQRLFVHHTRSKHPHQRNHRKYSLPILRDGHAFHPNNHRQYPR